MTRTYELVYVVKPDATEQQVADLQTQVAQIVERTKGTIVQKTDAQQSTDRYECHAWAVQQSGFDPTRPSGGVAESDIEARRADYRRAEGACLEGRGYSVK